MYNGYMYMYMVFRSMVIDDIIMVLKTGIFKIIIQSSSCNNYYLIAN